MKPIIQVDTGRKMPKTVVDALEIAYGHDRTLYMAALGATRWDALTGCWCHEYCQMYVGIEESDGYMHT